MEIITTQLTPGRGPFCREENKPKGYNYLSLLLVGGFLPPV